MAFRMAIPYKTLASYLSGEMKSHIEFDVNTFRITLKKKKKENKEKSEEEYDMTRQYSLD